MVLTLEVKKTDDGYIAEIPTLKGCESWAHTEDDVMVNIVQLLRFYLSLDDNLEIVIDKAYKSKNSATYKLVFDKE